MNYTKGEWKERMVMGERQIYVEKENDEIEVIAHGVRHWNASMIKAAPDMYEALKDTLNRFNIPRTYRLDRLWDKIIQALDKAEGK